MPASETKALIHTYTARLVDPLNLQPEDIDILDIAHALARQCRFSGHTKEFYSVAQHSVICSKIVAKGFEFTALMHDASEAYLQDVARPLKIHPSFGQSYRGAEKRAEKVIAGVFGTEFPMPPEVKDADNIALVTEARDLMHGTNNWTPFYQAIDPLPTPIQAWTPKRAEREFLARFDKLYS